MQLRPTGEETTASRFSLHGLLLLFLPATSADLGVIPFCSCAPAFGRALSALTCGLLLDLRSSALKHLSASGCLSVAGSFIFCERSGRPARLPREKRAAGTCFARCPGAHKISAAKPSPQESPHFSSKHPAFLERDGGPGEGKTSFHVEKRFSLPPRRPILLRA